MMPQTLYVRRYVPVPIEAGKTYTFTATVGQAVLIATEKLSDFENLRDEEIGVYELKRRERRRRPPWDWGPSAPSGWYQWTSRGLVYLGEKVPEDGLGCGELTTSPLPSAFPSSTDRNP